MNPNHLPSGHLLHQRYSIQKTLGQGGFGITYLAYDPVLAQEVCIKELFISGYSTRGANYTVHSQTNAQFSFPNSVQRFIQEAQQLTRFRHPNIVRVLDIFRDNQTAYMVMEFVPGETLKQKIQGEGAMNARDALKLIDQLLDAVEVVHSKGMLHRDIKPENILLSPEGLLVLIDFGSARDFTEGMTSTETAMISRGYSPPEQYSDRAQRGTYTDIYALGATLYYLLTGEKPIAATDRHLEELKEPHELNSGIDTQISEAVIKAMELKPQNRFQQVRELREVLNTMQIPTEKPEHPEDPKPPEPPDEPGQWHRGVVVALFISVLIIIVVYANYPFGPTSTDKARAEAEVQTIADSMMQAMEAENAAAETADSQSNEEARKEAKAQRVADSIMHAIEAENSAADASKADTTTEAEHNHSSNKKKIKDKIDIGAKRTFSKGPELNKSVGERAIDIANRIYHEMVFVAGATFNMGCTGDQAGECGSDEKPPHLVSLDDFYIGKYEVSQAQWEEVMGNNPSNFSGCDNCPVENVSWNDVQDFIRKLNQRTGKNFRLPTEAEWEYAARGGNQSRGYKYAGSNRIDAVAWYGTNSGNKIQAVGQKSPNELGIYDMSGNVWEWCTDWFGAYSSAGQNNPQGPDRGSYRVLRGGSWRLNALYCQRAHRNTSSPDSRYYDIGFRLVSPK